MIDVSPDLIAFLQEEYDRCQDETLEDERETAIDRYNGRPYGDEEDGKSQVVARDTAEVVDQLLISILRTIVSGDDVVEFAHRNSVLAYQATQTIKFLFMDEQDGYTVLHDWLKAGLLEKNAVAMTYGEPQPPKREMLQGVSGAALMAAQEQGIQIIEAEQVGEDPEQGPIFRVAALRDQGLKFCDAAVPNEEFYCSPDARTITEAPLKGRKVRRTISDLVEEGMDRDELEMLADAHQDTTIAGARNEDRNTLEAARKGANRVLWVHEEYARFDANEDGIAELLYVRRTEDYKVLSIEEMEDADDHPFVDWCPYPMQHRRVGQSAADKTMDLERIRTALFRQTLDGFYAGNNPSTYVHEDSIGDNTIEDLLTVRPGRLIRWKGSTPPLERNGSFNPAAGLSMIELMNGERENRTGIQRQNQGLDRDSLNNNTATAILDQRNAGQQMEEYVARNFGNAVAKLFTKKARLLKRHGKPVMVPIDGEFIEVDPTQWPDDMMARPRLGLGASRKEQRLAYRRELIGMQAQALQAGMSIVDEAKFFNSAKGFVNDAGLGDASEFFNDPSKMPPKEPQPDPAMQKVQADMQAKQAELQMKQQVSQGQLQLKLAEIQAKIELAREDAAAKMQLEQQKAMVEVQLAQQQQQFEAQLEAMKLQMQAESSARDASRRDYEAQGKISNMRAGGKLNK